MHRAESHRRRPSLGGMTAVAVEVVGRRRERPRDPVIEGVTAEVAAKVGYRGAGLAYRLAKQALDVAVAAPALVVLAPLFAVIALVIRLDSAGPAFFVQTRVGQGGRLFRMIKFRTMVDGSQVLLDGPHKRVGDARTTRVGRVLRKTSLDELPQLINVLLGQMSLVGPRPELPEIVRARYQTWQYERFLVPQGMTGWWQVTGRGAKLMCEHTEDDIYYLRRASFWFDLAILVRTVSAVLRKEGAF